MILLDKVNLDSNFAFFWNSVIIDNFSFIFGMYIRIFRLIIIIVILLMFMIESVASILLFFNSVLHIPIFHEIQFIIILFINHWFTSKSWLFLIYLDMIVCIKLILKFSFLFKDIITIVTLSHWLAIVILLTLAISIFTLLIHLLSINFS